MKTSRLQILAAIECIKAGTPTVALQHLNTALELLPLDSDGTTTARSMKGVDLKLWVQPEGGERFLLDWGPREAMMTKYRAEKNRRVTLETPDGKLLFEARP